MPALQLSCDFFKSPALDGRIVNQFALFSLMSDPRARLDH
jgi:hypothetical protein